MAEKRFLYILIYNIAQLNSYISTIYSKAQSCADKIIKKQYSIRKMFISLYQQSCLDIIITRHE